MKVEMSSTQTVIPPYLEAQDGSSKSSRPTVLLPALDTRQPERTVQTLTLSIEPIIDTKHNRCSSLFSSTSTPVVRLTHTKLNAPNNTAGKRQPQHYRSSESSRENRSITERHTTKRIKRAAIKVPKSHIQVHKVNTSQGKTARVSNLFLKGNKNGKSTRKRTMERTTQLSQDNRMNDATPKNSERGITPLDNGANHQLHQMLNKLPNNSLSTSSRQRIALPEQLRGHFSPRRIPASGQTVSLHGPPRSLGRPTNVFTRPMPNPTVHVPNPRNWNPAAQTIDHWRSWLELGVRFSGLPPATTTLDLWEAFGKEGQISTIELFEDASGRRDGRGRIRFRYDLPPILNLPSPSLQSLLVRHQQGHFGSRRRLQSISKLSHHRL